MKFMDKTKIFFTLQPSIPQNFKNITRYGINILQNELHKSEKFVLMTFRMGFEYFSYLDSRFKKFKV